MRPSWRRSADWSRRSSTTGSQRVCRWGSTPRRATRRTIGRSSIKQSEIEKDEPYNTRINRGLPPTPIGNPGLASIKAAAKPSTKKYLYYVRKANDDSGEHAFSTTYSEFEKDLARYNASRGDG